MASTVRVSASGSGLARTIPTAGTTRGSIRTRTPYAYPYAPYTARAPARPDEQTTEKLFVYPAQGQSAAQTAQDRKECNDWAVDQSGLDPATAKKRAKAQHLDEYNRAFVACMDGRNYTVK